jgi:hypothetical protein
MLRPWSDWFRRLPRQLAGLGASVAALAPASGAAAALLAAQRAEANPYR